MIARNTGRMLRCLVVLCVLAACPGTPKSSVGHTRETAIAVALVTELDATVQGTQSADVESPRSAPPHWYRVTLNGPTHLGGTALDNKGSSFFVVLFTSEGIPIRPNEVATGVVDIRVSGPTTPYRLQLVAMPELVTPVRYPHCNPNKLDPANPNCSGVVACDHNKPDFTNPSCCSMLCLRGPCKFEISGPADGPNDMYMWIRSGANVGLVNGSFGSSPLPMRDGTWKWVSVRVTEVEAERSKIVVGPSVDREDAVHNLVNLGLPFECPSAK